MSHGSNAPVTRESIIPRGKFRDRRICELSDAELQLSWAGFNGSRKASSQVLARVMREELDRRQDPATQQFAEMFRGQ